MGGGYIPGTMCVSFVRLHEEACLYGVQTHAKMAPEGRVAAKGQYTQSRIVAAAIVSDYDDKNICPPDPKNAEVRMRLCAGGEKQQTVHKDYKKERSLLWWWSLIMLITPFLHHSLKCSCGRPCVCVCVCVCVCACVPACMHACTCVCVCMCVCEMVGRSTYKGSTKRPRYVLW